VIERPAAEAQPASTRLDEVISEFSAVPSPQDRLKLLIEYSKQLKPMPAEAKTDANRVMGCTAQVNCSVLRAYVCNGVALALVV
jgi:sulfur transfer protein SufE